jgi:catechol 2,3-dioxygenase-like lactoylglutathione lyase family enzyme
VSIRQVDHINIASERLEETRAFYVDVLGLTEGPRPPFRFKGYWLYAGDRPIVHLQDSRGPVGPSQASALNHFAFIVDDFEGLIRRLEQHGVAYQRTEVPGTTVLQAFLFDPNGVRVELNGGPV